jgi:membrane-associated HD superfamily phosphohydrolase
MGIIEFAEENFLISFAIVLGIGIFQGAILARGIRARFPSLKRHARAASIILLILFLSNAIANVFKFVIPTKFSVSDIMTPTTPEEGFELLINVLGLNAGFFTVIAMFVTITIIVFLRFTEIWRPFQYFIFSLSVIMLILAFVGRFTDFVPTVFQILMYAFYQFGLTLGIFVVSRRKIDELPDLK